MKIQLYVLRTGVVTAAVSAMSAGAVGQSIEEIVVTAQKRAENVMEVPISIAAFGGDSLAKSNISSTDDLQAIVPGVEFRKQVSAFTPFIRGIGAQNAAIGTEASVAMYVDGIYQSLPVANAAGFNNLERIEVLKGPQGTLFGRNATGGAISIYTKDPQQETAGKVKVGYGDYDTSTVDFYGTTGITADLAADLAVQYGNRREGYHFNTFHNTDVSKERFWSARTKWLWTPGDDTEVRLSAMYDKSTGGIGSQRSLMPGSKDVFGNPGLDDPRVTQHNYIRGVDTGNSQFDGKDQALNSSGVSLRVDQTIGELSLVSITGYLDQESFYVVDQDVGPEPFLDIPLSHFNRQISQEVQLLSNNEGPFNWIAGLYFMNAKHSYNPLRLAGGAFAPLMRIDIRNTAETTSYAAFAEASYRFNGATKLTLGLRWTEDEKNLAGNTEFVIAPGLIDVVSYDEEKTWREPTWRVVLDHQFDERWMGYASYSRGFKAGSFNGVVTSGVPDMPVNPEILDAYEVGVKGQFFDDRAALTAAVFYYEFEDMQVAQQIPGGSKQSNAASSEIMGAELNGQIVLGGGFQLRASAAVTDSEFVHFPDGPASVPNPAGGNDLYSADLTGNDLPRTPKFSASVVLDHSYQGDIGYLDSNLTYYYNDGFYWEVDNRIEQESYGLLNAQLTWTDLSESYGLELWIKNIADEDYSVFSVSEATNDGYAPGAPRTYGVGFFVNF